MENVKTREQINDKALTAAQRAYRIATEVDLLPDLQALHSTINAYLAAIWQPIEFAPKRYSEYRSDNLLLRSRDYECAEGRWMIKDGETILKEGWYILGFIKPLKIEPTHFQYLLK